MQRFSFTLALVAALTIAPSLAATKPPSVYHVVYGTKDLGAWSTMKRSVHGGTYTSTSFDSSGGPPGFPVVTLTRPMSATDTGLSSSLTASNVQLVVTTMQNGKPTSETTCPTAKVFNVGTTGDPGTGTTNITFACITVSGGAPTKEGGAQPPPGR